MIRIALIGDSHESYTDFAHLLSICKRKYNPDLVFQVGDFGYYPRLFPESRFTRIKRMLERKGMIMHWVDGNHEDHSILQNMDDFTTSHMNVYGTRCIYHPRGTYDIIGGHVFLYIGGAESRDAHNRVEGEDYFADLELATPAQVNFILDQCDEIVKLGLPVIVISHTCPDLAIKDSRNIFNTMTEDLTRHNKMLTAVLETVKPVKWYHGHFHKKVNYTLEGYDTQFYSLPWVRNGYRFLNLKNIKTGEVVRTIEHDDSMEWEVLELND